MSSQNLRDLVEAEQRRSGRTKAEIARALGVHRVTLTTWMRGQKRPQPNILGRLARELQVTDDRLDQALARTFDQSGSCVQ